MNKVKTIRHGYDALNRGELPHVKRMVTDDVEWGTIQAFRGMRGIYRGTAGIDEWIHMLRSVWAFHDVSLDEVVGETRYALVAFERLRGRDPETGLEVVMPVFAVYWFDANKVRRRRVFADRAAALEAAGLRE
jgi:ketosteroid isomerase-like protein